MAPAAPWAQDGGGLLLGVDEAWLQAVDEVLVRLPCGRGTVMDAEQWGSDGRGEDHSRGGTSTDCLLPGGGMYEWDHPHLTVDSTPICRRVRLFPFNPRDG